MALTPVKVQAVFTIKCSMCEAEKCNLWAMISDGSDILIIQRFKNQVSIQPQSVTASTVLANITALSSIYSVGEHSVW